MVVSSSVGRIIAVGDRNQSCYGFRGAHSESMDELKRRFDCRDLPLSISYRCPVSVVEWVKQWVPEIETHEEAIAGYVGEEGTDWKGQAEIALDGVTKWQGLKHFQPGDVILCRLTRPLVALAFTLIRARIPCRVLGRDIGQGLSSLIKRAYKRQRLEASSPLDGPEGFSEGLGAFLSSERLKLAEKGKKAELGRLEDQVATIRLFMQGGSYGAGRNSGADRALGVAGLKDPEVGDLIAGIEQMFVDNGQGNTVTLSTVHKAKGLEWDRVFVLDAGELMPWKWASQPWELQQEQNLMYVAATRSKRELRYVTSSELGVPGADRDDF